MERLEGDEASPFLADVSRQLHLGMLAALLLPHINIFLKRSRRDLWKTEDPFLFNGLHFIALLLHLLYLVSFSFKRLFKVFSNCAFPKCFSPCCSPRAAGWIPAANQTDLTRVSRCLFLFCSPKARGKKHGFGSPLTTCFLWLHRVSSELHKALLLLHPVQKLFILPRKKIPDAATWMAQVSLRQAALKYQCISAQPSSQTGGVRAAAAGLRARLKLQTGKAEVCLPAAASPKTVPLPMERAYATRSGPRHYC